MLSCTLSGSDQWWGSLQYTVIQSVSFPMLLCCVHILYLTYIHHFLHDVNICYIIPLMHALQIPVLCKSLGKRAFKRHIELFFDPLFYSIVSAPPPYLTVYLVVYPSSSQLPVLS